MSNTLPAEGSVTLSVDGGIATVEFGHPKSNSLPGSVLRRLAESIGEVGRRPDVNVVALRSAGIGPFCAGASFDELVAIGNEAAGREFFLGFARVILAMIRCPKPIVARVHGKVVGGGVGIVAASDYAIATQSAALRLSELAVGIGPFVVGPVIERKIGAGAFGAMALDADWRSAQWGRDVGLYAQMHESPASANEAFETLVARLAASNADATARIKQTLWRGTDDWDRLLDERAAMSGRLVLSEHTRAAIAAFKSK
jgi:methylglutaconyl-CoA hydratase